MSVRVQLPPRVQMHAKASGNPLAFLFEFKNHCMLKSVELTILLLRGGGTKTPRFYTSIKS